MRTNETRRKQEMNKKGRSDAAGTETASDIIIMLRNLLPNIHPNPLVIPIPQRPALPLTQTLDEFRKYRRDINVDGAHTVQRAPRGCRRGDSMVVFFTLEDFRRTSRRWVGSTTFLELLAVPDGVAESQTGKVGSSGCFEGRPCPGCNVKVKIFVIGLDRDVIGCRSSRRGERRALSM